MNLAILFIEVILVYLAILLLYKFFKKEGLYIFAVLGSFISTILLYKTIDILSYESVLSISINTSLFIIANMLVQKNGPDEIKKLIYIILISSVFAYIMLCFTSLFTSSEYNLGVNNAYDDLFSLDIRLFLANLISMLLMIIFNSRLYHMLRRIKNKIWISNILSLMITSFIESIIFVILGYIGSVNLVNILNLIIVRYVLKIFISIIGTIDIYIENKSN